MKGKGPHPLLGGHLNQSFLAGRHLLNLSAALKVHLCQPFHLRTKGGFICVSHNEESPIRSNFSAQATNQRARRLAQKGSSFIAAALAVLCRQFFQQRLRFL
jgi:hypothetical protein